ncbi:hypothetical protein [Clostridium sp.]|uniref:hypothetical protein n=1 Tax=Clostridium sp. TaxID=1506 RepID=UPI002848A6C7|nr:hypothetical protein [Clostridium sp.]MDR3595876.1 hypothetical protein [Clostridium sp.]
MKMVFKDLLKKIVKSKRFYMLLIIYVFIGINSFYTYKNNIEPNINYNIYSNITNIAISTYLIIPLYLFLNEITTTKFNTYKVLLKYNNINMWWIHKTIGTFIISIVWVIIMNCTTFIVLFLTKHTLDNEFIKYMLLENLFQIVGLMILGNMYNLINVLSNKKYIGFLVTYGFILFSKGLNSGFKLKINTLDEYMFLLQKCNNYSSYILINDYIKLIWFILLFIVIYSYTLTLIEKKDIYWSE